MPTISFVDTDTPSAEVVLVRYDTDSTLSIWEQVKVTGRKSHALTCPFVLSIQAREGNAAGFISVYAAEANQHNVDKCLKCKGE